jgi:hypothetical protein
MVSNCDQLGKTSKKKITKCALTVVIYRQFLAERMPDRGKANAFARIVKYNEKQPGNWPQPRLPCLSEGVQSKPRFPGISRPGSAPGLLDP